MNLAVGLGSLAVLRSTSRLGPRLRYTQLLMAAFNLFFAFGYPAYSGIAQFGDWAAVISGLEPHWLWRILLAVVSIAGYYRSMQLLAAPLAPFAGNAAPPVGGMPDNARLGRITLTPYIAAMILACLA